MRAKKTSEKSTYVLEIEVTLDDMEQMFDELRTKELTAGHLVWELLAKINREIVE